MTRLSLLVALTLLVTACGRPAPVVPASPALVGPHATSASWVKRLASLSAELETFSAKTRFWEWRDGETATNVAEVFMARPAKIRANISESTQALKRGAKIVYLGDKKITVRLGFIKRTLPYDDPQVLSLRGWRIDQTDMQALIAGFIHPQSKIRDLGPAGATGRMLEATGGPALLPGVDRETIVLDGETAAPLRIEAFVGEQVVYRVDVSDIKLNPVLPGDIFEL